MNILDEIKAIIDLWGEKCDCGIFDCRSYSNDQLQNVYYIPNVCLVDVCENFKYIEVIGLSNDDFEKLENYYNRNYWCLKDYYID